MYQSSITERTRDYLTVNRDFADIGKSPSPLHECVQFKPRSKLPGHLYEYGTIENVKIVRDVLCDLHVVPKFNIAEHSIFPINLSGTLLSRVNLSDRIYARKELL